MTDAPMLPEFAGFFDNLRRGRLAFPHCEQCTRFHWYPMPRCPHCRSSRVSWTPVSPRGEVFSFTSVHHPFDPKRRDHLPYIVALVTFPDAPGVRLITNIDGVDVKDLTIGAAVDPVFSGGDEPTVVFRLAKH